MIVSNITVTYGRKLNLGDYNQVHLEVTLEVKPEPEDEVPACLSWLWETARESVKEQAMRLMKKQKEEPQCQSSD